MINERAWEMFSIIEKHYDFEGKRVVDFGCGYGDMMYHVLNDRAEHVIGIDKNYDMLKLADAKCEKFKDEGKYEFFCDDMESQLLQEDVEAWGCSDVAFCFSVLPYLNYPRGFVVWMMGYFDTVFIECQYRYDGPGNLAHNDDEMMEWLYASGVDIAIKCGETHVVMRNKYRTIWKCYRLEEEL